MLAKLSNSLPLKMQRAQDNQKDFIWVLMWARRVKGKEWTNVYGTMWSYLAKWLGSNQQNTRNLKVH